MDRSLDEFATDDEADGEDDTTGSETVERTGNDTTTEAGDGESDENGDGDDENDQRGDRPADTAKASLTVRPAESTMDWTPDGAACAVCEKRVERRWRDEAGLVCLDCKTW